MRINAEAFLALTVLLGTGAAVGVAVVTSTDDDAPAAIEQPAEPPVTAHAPIEAPAAKPAPPPVPSVTTTPATTPTEPWVDPFPPDPPDAYADVVPGPEHEGV